jgi:hypothetical protein
MTDTLPDWAEQARALLAANPTAEPTICGQDGRSIFDRPRCWDDCWGTCLTVDQQAVIDATGALPWPMTRQGAAQLAEYRAQASTVPDAAAQVLDPRVTCRASGERFPLSDACQSACFAQCGRSQ